MSSIGSHYISQSVLIAREVNRSARRKAAIKDYSNRRRQAAKDTRLAKAKRERAKLANDNRPTLVKTPDLSW
jgi:hypothetical protein